MNEKNPLETQLKSWAARRPSPGLERKLFGTPRSATPFSHSFAWLAPAAVCLLVTVALVQQRDATTLSLTSEHEQMVAMSLSNQSYAAYLPGSFQRQQNRWDTFGWTNRGGFMLSKHPFLPAKTGESDGR
jgi:hypothetical protein